MSEAGTAVLTKPEQKQDGPDTAHKRVTELRVTGHLMTLETGVFCVFQAPGSPMGGDDSGLPGVRISLPPGLAGKPDAVSISTFRPDGWLSGHDAAALVRVLEGPAQVLVTVYQSPSQGADRAPRLQVMRLNGAAAQARPNGAADAPPPPSSAASEQAAVLAHVQRTGDVGGKMGDWLGERGSKMWIEGFAVTPPEDMAPEDIEYQAVLGRGWNSPWMEGGKFCGSRGMALPLLGIRLRLKGEAAKSYTLRYAASFVDGTEVGPVEAGEACETENLAALEAIQVILEPRPGVRHSASRSAPQPIMPAAPPAFAKPAFAKPKVAAKVPPAAAGRKPAAGKPAAAKPMPSAAAAKPSPAAPAGRRGR